MPRTRSPTLTDAEAGIMNVLWDLKRATVAEVMEALPRSPAPAYNTVQTLLRILERKGYVTHEKGGRAFAYRPIVNRRAARRGAIRHLAARLFDGSPRLLLLNLLEDERVDAAEIKRLERLIDRR
jgi:predicted transcriptional regulator